MIVAYRDFRDEEYFIPREIFEKADINIVTSSSSAGVAIGKFGGEAKVDILLKDLKAEDYDAVVFIGGSGAREYIDNEVCHNIAKEALAKGRILAAICIAPAILARAGALKGKKATVWSAPLDKSAINILKEEGANYQEQNVVQDGSVLTAIGPLAAKDFAEILLSMLK